MRNATHPFSKPRLLIVGCGDIGLRVVEQLAPAFHIYALTSQLARFATLREAGALPILGNLDQPESLWRLSGLAQNIIHLAPPLNSGNHDRRTRNLLRILAQGGGGVTATGQFEQTGQSKHPQKPQIDQMVQKDFQEEGQDSQKVNHGGG